MLVADAANNNTESSAKQVWIFDTHHEAAWIVTEIAFPVLQLSVAHEDVVVIVGLEEGRAGVRG